MDSALGIRYKDGVILATDCAVTYSIFRLKQAEDKIKQLDDNKLLALSGQPADRDSFGEYIQKNMQLFYYRNNRQPISVKAAASFARSEMAQAIRKSPWQVNCLIGGFEEKQGPSLYWLDYMGTLSKTPIAAQGYAQHFCLSILDNHYREGMDISEAMEALQKCFRELKNRFLIKQTNFIVKVVNKEGVQEQKIEI